MGYTINCIDELKIIKHKITGVLDKTNLGDAWKKIVTLKEFYKDGYNILSDYRDSIFKFSLEETTILDNLIEEHKTLLDGKKGAVIVNVPIYTAISVMIKEKFNKVPNYQAKIFSTEEAAIKWLLE